MRRRVSKHERLAVFYDRLAVAPAANSADSALKLIGRLLTEVEDELSGIEERVPPPPPDDDDGRMYPPQEDLITRHANGSLTARTSRHIIEIGADGTIVIRRVRTGKVEFTKEGRK